MMEEFLSTTYLPVENKAVHNTHAYIHAYIHSCARQSVPRVWSSAYLFSCATEHFCYTAIDLIYVCTPFTPHTYDLSLSLSLVTAVVGVRRRVAGMLFTLVAVSKEGVPISSSPRRRYDDYASPFPMFGVTKIKNTTTAKIIHHIHTHMYTFHLLSASSSLSAKHFCLSLHFGRLSFCLRGEVVPTTIYHRQLRLFFF